MSKHTDNVPKWVRMAVGLLAVVNIFYGVGCYLDANILFHHGEGVDLANPFIRNAGYEFAARNLAIGLALGFVTIIKGAPEALVILTIVKALIEVQAMIISIATGNITAMLLVPFLFLLLELFIIKALVEVIKKEEAE